MSAACYLCAHGIPHGSAEPNPVAVCFVCGILCCDDHGWRDPGPPSFICALCQPTILTTPPASAALTSPDDPGGGSRVQMVARSATNPIRSQTAPESWRALSGDAESLARQAAHWQLSASDSASLSEEAALRMASAVALATYFALPDEVLPQGVRAVRSAMLVGR